MTRRTVDADPHRQGQGWDADDSYDPEESGGFSTGTFMDRALLRTMKRLAVSTAVVGMLGIVAAVWACGPALSHDLAAWSDPARDQWYRSLRVPDSKTSCCDRRDGAEMSPDKVKQDSDGAWWVDLGEGFIPVPPERVVSLPPSIDGLPYIFLMPRTPATAPGIRCFVPPVGTY